MRAIEFTWDHEEASGSIFTQDTRIVDHVCDQWSKSVCFVVMFHFTHMQASTLNEAITLSTHVTRELAYTGVTEIVAIPVHSVA